MGPLTWMLYINAFVYYLIMFVCPFVFINTCGEGINPVSHYIYATYAVSNLIFEIGVVIYIKKNLKDKTIMQINIWHVIELLFG